jgi:rSAM-associated Gly-rich repeat protein
LNIASHAGLLGFLLSLSALSIPTSNAMNQPNPSPSIEGRLNRITAVIRQRETQLQNAAKPGEDMLIARGFADGSAGGSFNQGARFGTATGPGGSTFNDAHPAYGGAAGWRDTGGFADGVSGGATFGNGAYGGAGFANGASDGAAFRNW